MDWPDVAKGLSIVGVVFLHISLLVPESGHTWVAELNRFLDPLRMPLFFMVSGLFSVKILNQNFEQLFKRRLWFYLVPYMLWGPLELFSSFLVSHFTKGKALPKLDFYWVQFSQAQTWYWFLYFLILFNLILWATRKLPAWTLCIVPFLPWLLMPAFSEEEVVWKSVLYLPIFFIGAYARPLIIRFSKAAENPTTIVTAVAIYVFAMLINVSEEIFRLRDPGPRLTWLIQFKDDIAVLLGGTLDADDLGVFADLFVRCLSLPAGIVLAVWLAKIKFVGNGLKFFGRYTLSIYLGHALGLGVLFGPLGFYYMAIDNTSTHFWNWTSWWILIGLVCAMLGSYFVYLVSRTPVVGWLIVPPRLPLRSTRKTSGGDEELPAVPVKIIQNN